jgi:hypothetical protein
VDNSLDILFTTELKPHVTGLLAIVSILISTENDQKTSEKTTTYKP